MPFWPGRESTASVKAVLVFTSLGHEEYVNMGFSKQRGDEGDGRGDVEVFSLTQLTFMTGFNIPSNVLIEMGPPKVNEEVPGSSKDSLMTEFVMNILDEREMVFGIWDELRAVVMIFPEELSIVDKVVLQGK